MPDSFGPPGSSWGARFQRQGVDRALHRGAERAVDHLMLNQQRLAGKRCADDAGLVVVLGSRQVAQGDLCVRESFEQSLLDDVGINHCSRPMWRTRLALST